MSKGVQEHLFSPVRYGRFVVGSGLALQHLKSALARARHGRTGEDIPGDITIQAYSSSLEEWAKLKD